MNAGFAINQDDMIADGRRVPVGDRGSALPDYALLAAPQRLQSEIAFPRLCAIRILSL